MYLMPDSLGLLKCIMNKNSLDNVMKANLFTNGKMKQLDYICPANVLLFPEKNKCSLQ